MRKIFHIATRDFIATVSTRGFVIALLLPVIFYGAAFRIFPRLMNDAGPRSGGRVVIIDPTNQVAAGLKKYLDPDEMLARRQAAFERARSLVMPGQMQPPVAPPVNVPRIVVDELPAGTSLAEEKASLRSGTDNRPLALIVVQPTAVKPTGDSQYGSFDLFTRPALDEGVQREIVNGMNTAIVSARVRAEGLDPAHVDTMTTVTRPKIVAVLESEESQISPGLSRLLPVAFMILLMMSVMSSGQYLMTTTIEEKSSRTIEVILSAVSPMQLMAGKILGQLAVGLLVLSLYSSVGLFALFSMALLGFLRLSLLIYLLIFFLITYAVVGALMAAIGSSVNELREAQGLVMPLTLMMMIPWLLWGPIVRDPNSMMAVTLSFLPPLSSYVMMLRLTSSMPPPLWQVWLAIAVGCAAAVAALWFASRVFRIGLLMYGRPPDFATLVRWAKQG